MAEYEPKQGWYSRWTQKIVNGLPAWNDIRKDRESVGQQLINAAAGKAMDHAWDEMDRALRNKFPGTVEVNQPDLITRVVLDNTVLTEPPEKIYNRVFNSSFEIWPNQSILPPPWRYSGDGTAEIVDAGFVGARALQLSAALGESVTVYQDLDLEIPSDQTWSFSCWYMINSGLSLGVPGTGFGMEITGYCVDNTTEVLSAAFASDTNGNSTKLVTSGSFTKDVTKVRVGFSVTHSIGFPFTSEVVIDLVKAEEGSLATEWKPHALDNWPHVTYVYQISPIWLESGNRAQFVETLEDFWFKALPTRASYLKTISDDGPADSAPFAVGGVTSYGTSGRFIETDFFDEDWAYTAEGIESDGTHSVRFIGTDVPDILAVFGFAFRNYRNYFEDGTITIEALTYFGGWLWIVHQMQDFLGTTRRWLSAVDVRTTWPHPNYLEVMSTIELPTPTTGQLITKAEFRYEDQQHLYIGDGLNTWVYVLHYDYFTILGNEIRLREDPTAITVVDADPTRRERTEGIDDNQMSRAQRKAR